MTERVRWVEADLGDWAPEDRFDLVTSHYAHPEMPQLDFYERIGSWVAPGGTLLLVGHLHVETPHDDGHDGAHGHRPSTTASVTAAAITARLDDTVWQIVTADERQRHLAGHGSRGILHDVVVRARRRTRHGH